MIKEIIKKFFHPTVLDMYHKSKLWFMRWRNSRRSTAEVFSEIYAKDFWGGKPGEFCSGAGSKSEFAEPYCQMLMDFIARNITGCGRIVDLGCGDFRVGQQIVTSSSSGIYYIGVDIVPELIERNIEKYADAEIEFICLDIIEEELPDGDICLIRQVLQHLSNKQIQKILKKISKYKYVFITEHYPSNDIDYIPNLDKPHGSDIRLYDKSAVYLDKEPFNMSSMELILKIPYNGCGELRTFKIENI